MSTIPTSAFADRLQTLNHDEFKSFVADLWSLAGWETSTDGDVVIVRKHNREQRCLVLPAGRLAQFRFETPPTEQFDQVIDPNIKSEETTAVGDTDAPLIDAHDLRHRLIYGCESDDAEHLWATYFDDALRSSEWKSSDSDLTWTQATLASVSLLLIVGAITVLVFGLPFLESESVSAQASTSALDEGLDVEIDHGPPEQTIDEPSAIAWGETVYAGTASGTFAALDGGTGETVWSVDLGNQIRSPLVSNGTVYVRSTQGIHALDAVTGERKWNYTDVTVEWSHYDVFSSTSTRLTVVNGTLYFSDSQELVALDANTGEERWIVPMPTTITGAPTVFNDTIYVGSLDGELLAHDVADGNETWRTEYRDGAYRTSGVLNVYRGDHSESNGSLLVSDDSTLYEIDAETGESGWEFESTVSGGLSPAIVLDRGGSLGLEGNATNLTNGETTVYVADTRSYLYALDPNTGERRWTYQDPATKLSNPVVGGPAGNESAHTIYVVSSSPVFTSESKITAINASSGTERWQVVNENVSVQAPTVFEETLYAGTDSGEVIALDTANGTEQWRADAFDGSVSGAVSVVTEPLGGDSVDSRIRLGIEGHHDWFTDRTLSNADQMDGISVLETDVQTRVAAGEKLKVRVSLANQGDSRDNTTVVVTPEWDVTPQSQLQTEIDLAPGEAREITFSFAVPRETGTYSSEILVGDEKYDSETAVIDRPVHEVTGLDDSDTVWQEDETEIIASVRNTGDVEATTPIALVFGGEIVDLTQQTIGPNETVSVTFSLAPENAPAGEYNYSVATNDHVESSSIEVLAIDRRENALPIVTQVFAFTLLLSGLALGWRVLTDVRGPLLRRSKSTSEQ